MNNAENQIGEHIKQLDTNQETTLVSKRQWYNTFSIYDDSTWMTTWVLKFSGKYVMHIQN